jgi:hypothetical protein
MVHHRSLPLVPGYIERSLAEDRRPTATEIAQARLSCAEEHEAVLVEISKSRTFCAPLLILAVAGSEYIKRGPGSKAIVRGCFCGDQALACWFTETPNSEKEGEPLLITFLFGLLIVVSSVVLAVAGLRLVQRLVPLSKRERNNTATGGIYVALYVMVGVSIGFSLFLTWQQYNTARQVAKNEAVAVEQIYRIADRLPEPDRSRIQDQAISYARSVVEEEWPSMRQGQESKRAKTRLGELRRSVQDFQPRTDAQSDLYSESLSELDELEANRELRLLAVNEGIPYVVWVVLVTGGVLTVAFAYLFGIEPAWLHTVAVAGLALMVSLVLHVIGVLDYPFNGGVQVQPEAFERVLGEIGGSGGP